MGKKIKKILITGALGQIGSGLKRNISNDSIKEVIILDNLESRRYPSLFDLPTGVKFRFIKDDVTTADFGKHLAGVDLVIHLANTNFYEGSQKAQKGVELANLRKLKRIATACLENNVRLFFPSSTSVYVGQSSIVDETYQNLKPQNLYTQSKYACEKYLNQLGKLGLKYAICRFGTIFGYSPGMRWDTAVNKFTWQAVVGEPITVWKTAWKQKRPYLYLGDCIKAINFIIEKDLFDKQIYNVITGSYTVEDVVKELKQFIPKLKVTYVDSPIMNDLSFEVNDSKFRSLGFTPKGSLAVGIKGSIDKLRGIIL